MTRLKVTGGILLGFGVALAGVTLLSLLGAFSLPIDFFGFEIDTRTERLIWIGSWSAVVAVGFLFLYLGRSGQRKRDTTDSP